MIGRLAAQSVAKSYYLALIRAYADGETVLMDTIRRRADVFRPVGIDASVIIANTFLGDAIALKRVTRVLTARTGKYMR